MQRRQDQRSRSVKPITVHGLVQSGDLVGLQKLLHDKPFLLNERNHVMAQTPLHVAAGNDRDQIVKFLLNRQGSEKVELEAKNMYGETPLHMAAKNGCNEANGMTPLHLAVWDSIQSDNHATVKTILENTADCSAEDDEGMTPIKHLSKGPGSEKLQELLLRHLEEQRKRRALEACTEAKAKMDELEKELSNIVGKSCQISGCSWMKAAELLDERRRALGLKVGIRRPPHMAFLGNPGTGKTIVARVLGKLLHMVGILPTDKETEVQRTDLVGEFVGHTRPKTRRKIQEAEGGILFVDEAYSLDAIGRLIERETTEKQRKEMNGGLVDPMLINARENLDLRLSFDCIDADELRTITLEDLEAGIRLLTQ
ncbi:protein CfxQ-like isoform 2 [Hibiscus syriacus]|uniref:Protein CfxQ-like isoform 2 n=1 Tax=Hibiscus syriacus TaxID=106335 RepID=A0A6A2W9N1_HIBSY|nr:protein CfxQ-like isoform 2 [Hibiscus syriacus]